MTPKKRTHRNASINSERHPYLRSELWANGYLVFWNDGLHKPGAYDDFHQRQIAEAARMNKT
jgi:hypothetical protein